MGWGGGGGEKQNKNNLFLILKTCFGSTELSQCDCKYHFYGIRLGIGGPDRFVSSLILHVSHRVCVCVWMRVCVCVCVCVDVRMYPIHSARS